MLKTENPVKYRGVKYRNPIEAKWAAFFHHYGVLDKVIYDPRGTGTPSFIYHAERAADSMYIHVTDATTLDGYVQEALRLNEEAPWRVLVVGLYPFPVFEDARRERGMLAGYDVMVGLLSDPAGYRMVQPIYWSARYGANGIHMSTSSALRPNADEMRRLKTAWAKATNDIAGLAA